MGKSLVFVLLLAAPAWAGTAHVDDEVLIAPHGKCEAENQASWKIEGATTMSQVLTRVADVTCESFRVPRAILGLKVTVDTDAPVSRKELREWVRRVRANGFERVFAADLRVRPATDSNPPLTDSKPPLSAAELEKDIHCARHKCTVARALVKRLSNDTAMLATLARVVPSFHDGKIDGFEVLEMPPEGLLARLGFENGDTIRTIDGLDVSSPDKALEAYDELRSADTITVSIVRRGRPITLELVAR